MFLLPSLELILYPYSFKNIHLGVLLGQQNQVKRAVSDEAFRKSYQQVHLLHNVLRATKYPESAEAWPAWLERKSLACFPELMIDRCYYPSY